jgi:hypothetical protein
VSAPTSLTRSGLNRLRRADLIAWAERKALLEHLNRGEVFGMTNTQIVDEILGALLRVDVELEYRAFADDSTRSAGDVAEYIGGID